MAVIAEKLHFAFNVWDFESAIAVVDAAALVRQDVILQTSVTVFDKLPGRIFSDFIKQYSTSVGIHVWLNLDHCKNEQLLIRAVDNGWDMVMADGSSMPIEQNIAFTNRILSYAHQRGALVEAEVGRVWGAEEDVYVRDKMIASKDDIDFFINSTDVDFIAVAFGNAHGNYKTEPQLHYELIEYTVSLSKKPFVVHGGSGLSEPILTTLINTNGVKKINISTDLKKAYQKAIMDSGIDYHQPIEVNARVHDEIVKTVISKLRLNT